MLTLRAVLSILLLPVTVALVVPLAIVARDGSLARSIDPIGAMAIACGCLAALGGLALVVATVRLFATRGRGTLAPWDPPRRLVVVGVYRRVRNPMITGVLLVLLGEGIALRSVGVLTWALGFFALNATYIPLVEEPGLARRFGKDYETYRRNVPRWVPRRTPWTPEES